MLMLLQNASAERPGGGVGRPLVLLRSRAGQGGCTRRLHSDVMGPSCAARGITGVCGGQAALCFDFIFFFSPSGNDGANKSEHQFVEKGLCMFLVDAQRGQSLWKLQLSKTGVSLLLSHFCSWISISVVLFVVLIICFHLLYCIVGFLQRKPTPTTFLCCCGVLQVKTLTLPCTGAVSHEGRAGFD